VAMGKPVALDARAEERLTRGFISTTSTRPSSGFTANCTLEPPQATPTRSRTAREQSRRCWSSVSVRVWHGATVMESPVCTPMGSRFSMEQTTTPLPAPSRTTSISISFQPSTDRSTSTSDTGESERPSAATAASSPASRATPPPAPPSVKAGRTTTG